jgi:hypothetical protein
VRRAPLSDLVEVEGVLAVTELKAAGWRALVAAGVGPGAELDDLLRRAERQLERVTGIHRLVAASSLTSSR